MLIMLVIYYDKHQHNIHTKSFNFTHKMINTTICGSMEFRKDRHEHHVLQITHLNHQQKMCTVYAAVKFIHPHLPCACSVAFSQNHSSMCLPMFVSSPSLFSTVSELVKNSGKVTDVVVFTPQFTSFLLINA